ncbi:MAG: hypothetical protein Q9182_000756 [Xanthomendoza sp. 2 TL-2023]
MAYPPPSDQPTSFKTNVNRAKTKRWVEAKSYSYDGGDWGEMDEYDEYDGYDEPPPPSRPTGLRQRGQSASRDQQGILSSQQAPYRDPQVSQHGYGNLGPQLPPQQQSGTRSVTNPPYQQSQLPRSGSFDRGDERRAFSAAVAHHGPTTPNAVYQEASYAHGSVPPQSHQTGESMPHSYQNQPGTALPQPSHYPHMLDRDFQQGQGYPMPVRNEQLPYSDQPQRTSMGSRTQSMTSNISSNDFHNRRDFSPSAVPPPLHTRGSPSPHNFADSQSAWRPPRKSSLSQQNHPDHVHERQGPTPATDLDAAAGEAVTRDRSGSDIDKPLPFVRPADIYRRMQEEKERERQSQDSSRPSMDAIMTDDRSRTDQRRDSNGASERSEDPETRQGLRSSLDPVTERKSEYGMDDIAFNEPGPGYNIAAQETTLTPGEERTEPRGLRHSLRPQLPDVARMSGFGELFASTPQRFDASPATSTSKHVEPSHFSSDQSQAESLQHQPSIGLRSVVHQAFDTTDEPIPETPSSSIADSSIDRSGSGGTSAVSPIISRGPSSATTNLNFRDLQIRPATPPAVGGNLDFTNRPSSSGSLSTPKAIPRRSTPDPTDQRPAKFMPGHRRDLSTPSPDNSPARTPALEANKQLQQPQEAELAMTTPVETHFPSTYGQPGSLSSGRTSPPKSMSAVDSIHPTLPFAGETPKSPAESTRSRVRNLADKFESGRSSPATSERAPSPVKTSFVQTQAGHQPRPLPADRLESFRPKLPGGWESSASLAPFAAPSKPEATATPIPLEQREQKVELDRPQAPQRQESESKSQAPEEAATSDPFASLAAAGSALAGAFSYAISPDKDQGSKDPHSGSPIETRWHSDPSATEEGGSDMVAPRKATMNTSFIPEASKPMSLATPDDSTSSIMPTPLDKVSQHTHTGESKVVDYFAASPEQQQHQMSVDSYTTQDSTSTKRSQILPSLSTDTVPQYESDRLRREIIRELSPRLISEPRTADSSSPSRERLGSAGSPSVKQQHHESLIIPQEYDKYWNGSSSEQSSRTSSIRSPSEAARDAIQGQTPNRSTEIGANGLKNAAPEMGDEHKRPLDESSSGRPDMPPHRFSWEASVENTTPKQLPQNFPKPLLEERNDLGADSDESRGQPSVKHDSFTRQQDPGAFRDQGSVASRASFELGPSDHSMEPQAEPRELEAKEITYPGRNDSIAASDPLAHHQLLEPNENDIEPANPNSGRHPDGLHGREEEVASLSKSLSKADDLPLAPGPPDVPPKIQSFREILALKEPRDRIKGYNETREQFANMNTGLAHWLAVASTEMPEHKEVLPNGKLQGVAGARPVASRTKLGGLLPSGASSSQQPYHQQLLNANSPSSASNRAQASGGSSTPGLSGSGGSVKLSSQQMQARGKDLLHSAGVFGGKANVAAKGLFSKGKSKFRGGNTDKQDRETTPTQESSRSSPSTPKSEVLHDQSYLSEQSIAREPGSHLASSEQPTPNQISLESQGPRQTPTNENGSLAIDKPLSSATKTDSPIAKGEFTDQNPNQDVTDNLTIDGTTGAAIPNDDDDTENRSIQGPLRNDENLDVQGPGVLTGNNRTPTQADYANYFQHESPPTVTVPNAQDPGTDEETSYRGHPTQRTMNEQCEAEHHTLPIANNAAEVLPANTIPTGPNQHQHVLAHQDLQRGSEDSEGTFHTAGSMLGADTKNTSNVFQQELPSAGQAQPAKPSLSSTSSSESSSITPPVAVPAANIHDQTRARPFSFIQFSQTPTPKPLQDYSHRRLSIESLPSQIDSNPIDPQQDVPPSPISPQRSMIHEQRDQPDLRSSIHHGIDHDFQPSSSSSTRAMTSSPSRSFSRPFQESSTQNQPDSRLENTSGKGDELPAQHYPAPISRPDTVNPRQQATEYSLEGIGPPPPPQPVARPMESRPNSKRESRSSAFFRSFRTPTDSASSPPSSERDGQDDIDSKGDSKLRKTKSKRSSSLFRSLTGGARSSRSEETSQNQQDLAPSTQRKPSEEISRARQDQAQSPNTHSYTQPNVTHVKPNALPAKTPDKHRSRLTRTAGSTEVEQQPQEPVKKRRFSAIGSLFGRSRDQKGPASAQVDRAQQGSDQSTLEHLQQPRDRSSRLSSFTRSSRGTTQTSGVKSSHETPYGYTRDSLAKEGLLPQNPRLPSSKPPEPSAYYENSSQQQQRFPPRQQSLSQGTPREDQRPSGGSRQVSLASSKSQPQHVQAPVPDHRHRVQSTITTQLGTRQPGVPAPPDPKSRQLTSFTTTTTTTTTRGGMTSTSTRQEPLGNSFLRSNSPPPPPPPPKDTWHQVKPHQRSTSSISVVRSSTDRQLQISNNKNNKNNKNNNNIQSPAQSTSLTTSPPPQDLNNHRSRSPAQQTKLAISPPPQSNHARFPSIPSHQSLPPLQTNLSHSSSPPAGPRPYDGAALDLEARRARRSQIESSGTPREESATIAPGAGSTMPDWEARKIRQSQIESMVGAPKAEAAGGGSGTSDAEARRLRRSQIESGGGTPQPGSAHAPEVSSGAVGAAAAMGEKVEQGAAGETGKGRKSEDEPIVMTATSFPGQEWQPDYGYGGWED